MFKFKNYFKLPEIYKIIGYDKNNTPIVREKTSEEKADNLFKIKWSWFDSAIRISNADTTFLLYPTEFAKMDYRDAECLYLHYYDNIGYSHLPSEKQSKIIMKNINKINNILKRKKCPTIPQDSKLWLSCPTYAYIDMFGEKERASINEMHIALCVKTIL